MNIVISTEALPLDDLNYHYAFTTTVPVTFRECVGGETLEIGYCQRCPVGYYSFDVNDNGCLECPEDAYCPGGAIIEVDEGKFVYNWKIFGLFGKFECILCRLLATM